jgi:signal recognition particle subunit SRP54
MKEGGKMFKNLAQRLTGVINSLVGGVRLTERNLQEVFGEIRRALLEADVALPVVKKFIHRVQEKAMGEKVLNSLSPGQVFTKWVYDELVHTLGEAHAPLNLKAAPPAVILLLGLQGTGKTTTAAKLAYFIKTRLKKTVLLSSTDVYRPVAIAQLKTLAEQHHLAFFDGAVDETDVIQLTKRTMETAKKQSSEVIIIDTAGRLHIDDMMMRELQKINQLVQPVESLLVIDSMMGQDAVNTATVFGDALPITGIILTKTDGDARGGAALSVWEVLNQPIKFVGTGEKIDALEDFYPDRMASRILGMGDVVSLVEEAHRKVDRAKAEKMAKKIKKGKGFDLQDFLEQFEMMEKMGGATGIMAKLPGMQQLPAALKTQVSDEKFRGMKALIQSMTQEERHFPGLIKGSRKKRIVDGSGRTPQELAQLLKQYLRMEKLFKKFSKFGGITKLMGMMGKMGNLGGLSGMNGLSSLGGSQSPWEK